jgi:hypothetical protein
MARRGLRGHIGRRAATLAALLLAAPALAAPSRDAAGTAGPWMLSLDGTPRRCRVMLSPDAAGIGQAVRFPAGCRRALPILNGVAGWLVEGSTIRLVGADAQPLLDFGGEPDAEGAYRARTAGGESYALAVETPENGFDAPPRVTHAALTAPEAAVPPVRLVPGVLSPGVYTLDRFVEKDTCRLRLVPGADDTHTVEMLEGCRDGGLAVFDPIGWRFADGRLTLVARKGHTVDLIAIGDGRWRRDPEVGTTFVLRRVEN